MQRRLNAKTLPSAHVASSDKAQGVPLWMHRDKARTFRLPRQALVTIRGTHQTKLVVASGPNHRSAQDPEAHLPGAIRVQGNPSTEAIAHLHGPFVAIGDPLDNGLGSGRAGEGEGEREARDDEEPVQRTVLSIGASKPLTGPLFLSPRRLNAPPGRLRRQKRPQASIDSQFRPRPTVDAFEDWAGSDVRGRRRGMTKDRFGGRIVPARPLAWALAGPAGQWWSTGRSHGVGDQPASMSGRTSAGPSPAPSRRQGDLRGFRGTEFPNNVRTGQSSLFRVAPPTASTSATGTG